IGSNGIGKTNILEAIGVLSLTKSFLGIEEHDLPTWETHFYRVRGHMQIDGGEQQTLEVVSTISPRKQKACFLNDVALPLSRIVGLLPTVTFLPQDLDLFTGSPANRRRFIDQLPFVVVDKDMGTLSGVVKRMVNERNEFEELEEPIADVVLQVLTNDTIRVIKMTLRSLGL
ncbi:MAG: replication and repair protein RecF protein, partial [Parcubacteria group bacterium GW2011_GWA2_47_8]